MLKLVRPSVEYKKTYLEALKEFKDRNESSFYFPKEGEEFEDFVKRLLDEEEGIGIPEGWVADSVFWLVDGERYIGKVSVRHELTEYLNNIGGHIGYDIRPSERQKGYGTKILEMVLPEVRKLGIKKALITCDETNIGSKKIIEKNGGVLENSFDPGNGNPRKLRYWISL